MIVLGVDVGADLLRRWSRWLAPQAQPFFVDSLAPWPKAAAGDAPVGPELTDTYKVWKLDRSLEVLWLDEPTFESLSRSLRASLVRSQVNIGRGAVPTVKGWMDLLDHATLRAQADGHRFVWWPSVVAAAPETIVARVVSAEGFRSRHEEVGSATWASCAGVLPGARELAGSFPSSSGPNCFGTVMAAAGVAGADRERVVQAPFVEWLDSNCRPGGRDDEPGTVLVWRNRDRLPGHAAVTIGDGWVLEKPSQAWSAPRTVRRIDDVVRTNRLRGERLGRHRIRT